MIDGDVAVVDAVLHGFNWKPEASGLAPGRIHEIDHLAYSSKDPRYRDFVLSRERYERTFSAEELVACVFEESWTDLGAYHHLRGMGIRRPKNGGESSALATGERARELAPGRVFIYGALSNIFDTARAIDEIDELVDDHGIIGLKFYPWDWDSRTDTSATFLFDDEKVAFPLIEHAQKRGIKVMAVHKSMGSRLKAFGVADIEGAAVAFPEMNFEIVHAGVAFMEDTMRLAIFDNIYLNLEATSGLLGIAPRRFADVLGQFLFQGSAHPRAADRIVWATGAVFLHPQPLLELFWNFQMPEDLMEGYGYPEVTREIKKKILGENFARMHGLDLKTLLDAIPDEPKRQAQLRGELAAPWHKIPMAG